MKNEITVVLAEDDPGHATLVRKNLARSGLKKDVLHFMDGQETLDFFFRKGEEIRRESGNPYLLVLDIRLPKVDGFEVLSQLKQDAELRKVPVIILTTTDDPFEVERCYHLGCSNYITKPVNYEKFVEAVQQLGQFLQVIEVPKIHGAMNRESSKK